VGARRKPTRTRNHRYGKPRRASSPSRFSPADGFIEGTRKDPQTLGPDWLPVQAGIDGVRVIEVRNVTRRRGLLTEVFRSDWEGDGAPVDQVFQVVLGRDEVSAWHVHRTTRDRLFVNQGAMKIVLYDARRGSPTYGVVNEFRFGIHRPALVVVPAGVFHGIQNLRDGESSVLNLVDRAYSYEDPDHWRLPVDSTKIPYRFSRDAGPA
jgi:dTDP-4-dehydrorhamnose 3,5-epimerase